MRCVGGCLVVDEPDRASEIRRLSKIYRDSVRAVYDGEVFFVDTLQLTEDDEQNLQNLNNMLLEQYPEDAPLNLDNPEDRETGLELIATFTEKTGYAAWYFSDFCVVEEHIEAITPEEWVSKDLDLPLEALHPVPGSIEDYITYAGLHEGAHCHYNAQNLEVPLYISIDRQLSTLLRESMADNKALMKMYEESPKLKDVIAAIIDTRAINAFKDPTHATALTLDPHNMRNGIAPEHYEAVDETYNKILDEFYERVGLTPDEIVILGKENPDLSLDILDNLIAQGAFDENPLAKDVVMDYSASMRRRVNFDSPFFNKNDSAAKEKATEYLEQYVAPPPSPAK